MKLRNFRLQNDSLDNSGSGPVDRGDNLEAVIPEAAAPDAAQVAADAAAKKLEDELKAKTEDDKLDDEPKDDKKKDSRIPLSRHEAVLTKEREKRAEVERQLAQYQQGNQIADVNKEITSIENNVIKLEKEYANLLTDGKIDEATAVMADIRKAERNMAEAKSDMKIHAAEARATERARYNTALERIESAFPTLNEDHADFDAEVMSEVVELKEAYQLKGLTPTLALQKAVKLLVEPRTTRQEVATSSQPRVDEKSVAAERKKAALTKTNEAMEKTPPSLAKSGLDSDKLGGGAISAQAVMKMSQKEFAGLSEATLAEMRGDTL